MLLEITVCPIKKYVRQLLILTSRIGDRLQKRFPAYLHRKDGIQ